MRVNAKLSEADVVKLFADTGLKSELTELSSAERNLVVKRVQNRAAELGGRNFPREDAAALLIRCKKTALQGTHVQVDVSALAVAADVGTLSFLH